MALRSSYVLPLLAASMMANWTQNLDGINSTFPLDLGRSTVGGWFTPKHRRRINVVKRRARLRQEKLSRRRNR